MIYVGVGMVCCMAGFIVACILCAGKINDLQNQVNTLCADCSVKEDVKALEEMYRTEQHARRTAHGELSAAKRKLAYALHELDSVKNGYAIVGG